MAVLYMAVCSFDFIVAPILWSIAQALSNDGHISSQWQPLTLQGAGLLHLSFGAILGVAAYGRTQEKLAGVAQIYTLDSVNNVTSPIPTTNFGKEPIQPYPPQVFLSKHSKPGPFIEEPEL